MPPTHASGNFETFKERMLLKEGGREAGRREASRILHLNLSLPFSGIFIYVDGTAFLTSLLELVGNEGKMRVRG